VNRRLLITAFVAAALGGGLAAPALADDGDPQRDKICVKQPTLLPNGYCITWIDPTGAGN
jgi:hypothetical protein